MQSLLRRRFARQQFLSQRQAAIRVQAVWRGSLARKHLHVQRQAAIVIQVLQS